MKIVNISGGLGNQMFQYAFLLALRDATGDEVLMDVSKYKTYNLHNGFELEKVFNITARCATKEELKKVTRYTTNYKLSRIYRKFLPDKKTEIIEKMPFTYNPNIFKESLDDLFYEGIWQNYKYFDKVRSIILQEFTYKNSMSDKNIFASKKFADRTTVSIHVRRGDYLKHKNYIGLCGLGYYTKAIAYLKSKYEKDIQFAIFSNDINWCIDNIIPQIKDYDYTLVDWNLGADSYNDMRLMSYCKINIIANSSFSWWAAYLNPNPEKIIIAPEKWTNMPVNFSRQMPDWILF